MIPFPNLASRKGVELQKHPLLQNAFKMPSDKCLFCDKSRITRNGKEEQLVKCITKTSEESINAAAERQKDDKLLLKIRGVDLVAVEAHYHNWCRREYTRSSIRHSDPSNKDSDDYAALQAAHKAAFDHVCSYVNDNIIVGLNVVRMTMLRERYLQYMLENSPTFFNTEYKTDKLKDKLVNRFGNYLQFWQPNYKSELVYSSGIEKGQAVEAAFESAASEAKILEEAALILRREIQSCYNVAGEMPWPPLQASLWMDLLSLHQA